MRDEWLFPKDSKSLPSSITDGLITFHVLFWVDHSSSDSFGSYLFFTFIIMHLIFIILHSYPSSSYDRYSSHIISLCSLILSSITFSLSSLILLRTFMSHGCSHRISSNSQLTRSHIHIALCTWGYGLDHWAFKPSFLSFFYLSP